MLDAFGADGLYPSTVQVLEQILSVLSLTAAGLGVTLIPASIRHLKMEGLVYRPLHGLSPHTDIVALWSRNSPDLLLRGMLRVIRELKQSDELSAE